MPITGEYDDLFLSYVASIMVHSLVSSIYEIYLVYAIRNSKILLLCVYLPSFRKPMTLKKFSVEVDFCPLEVWKHQVGIFDHL